MFLNSFQHIISMIFKRVLLISVSYIDAFYKGGDAPEPGLGYMAQILETNKIEYDVLDMNLGYEVHDVLERIRKFKPDLIGIAMKTFSYKRTYEIIKEIKKQFPNVKILTGGSHLSIYQDAVLKQCKEIDFGVHREGEEVLSDLCMGKPFKNINGLIYREGGKVIFNPSKPTIIHLDEIPFPKYKKFELEKYWYPARYIITSRGCPERCTFCSVPTVLGQYWRARSPENVLEEITYWYNKGWKRFEILDDNFTFHKERAAKICDLIFQSGMKIEIDTPNGIRADRVDRELLQKMKDVGWKSVSYGVDGGNNKILQSIKKGETIEQIDQSTRDAIDVGLDVILHFIIGLPGETIEDIEDSFAFALKHPIKLAIFNNVMPYPGTELYEHVLERKYLLDSPEEYMNTIDKKHNIPVIETPELSVEQRKMMLKKSKLVRKMVEKRYKIRVLRKQYGIPGKVLSLLYQTNIVNDDLFERMKNMRKRIIHGTESRVPEAIEH